MTFRKWKFKEETIEEVDLDAEIPCAWKDPECDQSAIWGAWHSCCGIVEELCDDHRIEQEVWTKVHQSRGNTVYCLLCKSYPEFKWIRL